MSSASPALHSGIGASSMKRWRRCAGSRKLCATVPNVESVYAAEGTFAHLVGSTYLEMGKWINSPAEMKEAVLVYTKYLDDLCSKIDFTKGKRLVEYAFDMSFLHPDLYGTADAVIYDGETKTLNVVDYKHGAGVPVEVLEHGDPNDQLRYYGLGALLCLKLDVEKVVLTLVQPRCFHPDGPIRSVQLDVMELMDFAMDLVDAAKATEKEDAPLIPGKEQCMFCSAKPVCPALARTAQEVARSEFSIIPSPSTAYDVTVLGETLEKLDLLEGWIKGLRAFAYSEAESGKKIPGWKLVAKRSTRKWNDVEAVSAFFQKEFPNVTDVFEAPALKSVAQVEKVLHERQHPKIMPFIVSVSSGNTLVPADDKRGEIQKMTASEEFGLADLLS